MASGKSTIAEMLARHLDYSAHLHGDVFRRMICFGRADMSAIASEEAIRQLYLRYQLTANTAKSYFDHGFSVVVQDNYYGSALTYMLKQLDGYPVKTIVLCPDAATIREREMHRGKCGYGGFSIEPLYKLFLEETPRTGFWINSSNQTPQETLSQIIHHFHL